MCYFITIGVPARHRQLVEALQKGRFRVDRSSNPSVARLFPPDDALFTLTRGGCSCDLYTEPRSTIAEDAFGRVDHRAKFCERIAGVVEAIGRVRLFVHMYSGDIDSENIGTAAHVTIRLEDFVLRQGAFQVNTVVNLVREARVD